MKVKEEVLLSINKNIVLSSCKVVIRIIKVISLREQNKLTINYLDEIYKD